MKLETEFKISFIISFITIFFLIFLEFYESFIDNQEIIEQLILYTLSFLVGLIGVALAALAILTSFFNKELIKKVKIKNVLELLKSFYFIAKLMGVFIAGLIVLFFIILSKKEILDMSLFYILTYIYIFCFYYNIFYIIELFQNIIKLFKIKYKYEIAAYVEEKNEIELLMLIQDYTLEKLITYKIIEKENLKKEMYELVNRTYKDKIQKNKSKKLLDNYFQWDE